jgi:hypothetical protein
VDRLDLKSGRTVFAIIKSVSLDRRSVGRAGPAGVGMEGDEIAL